MPSSSDLPVFRPKRALFGYERKATDTFLARVAEVLASAREQLERNETELAEHREKERSLNEALLQVANFSDAVKADARIEEQAIRDRALALEQIVTATASELGAFLRETLEKVDRLTADLDHEGWAERLEQDQEPDPTAVVAEDGVGGHEERPERPVDPPQKHELPRKGKEPHAASAEPILAPAKPSA